MLALFLITLLFIAIALLFLGVKVFFTKKGKFPNTHVGGNKALKEKGIYCVQTQDYMEYHGIKASSNHKTESKNSK